ncbi:extracellular solute-binding protein [Benzoatithermus flavus]|uniref:Putrescine-binding periplasmic protein n=1 Tax=Benzoatithermus flavus TaxID=3108223 RepID=A0ABU8XQI7_9PROT
MRSPKLIVSALALVVGASSAAHAGGELYFYNWSNYFPPKLIEKFEKETGIDVTLDVYDSNETLLAKLQAGAAGYDVVVPSDYMVKIMKDAGMLEKIDVASMPNFKNVAAAFADPPFDPGRAYSAPYLWGTTGFTYDSARVPNGRLEESWKSFFEPPAELKGQVAALNDEVELWNAASYYLGIDKCTEDSKDAQKILSVLEKQKPMLAMYQSDGTIERMIAKEVIVHMQWNGASHRTREKLPTAVYVYPKEGIGLFQDNFVIPKGAKNVENAKIFINWMMAPENIAEATNFAGYMNAINGSEQFMDASLRDDPAVNMPADKIGLLRPSKECSTKSRELRDKVWTRLKK